MNAIYNALDALFTRYVNLTKLEHNRLPVSTFEPHWPSPCDVEIDAITENDTQGNMHFWRPVSRQDYCLFNDLESGFEFPFPEQLKWYYGSFWSNGICVESDDHAFNLIQIWNEEDEAQLKENMLGHVFAKIKNKQPITFFIGCTDGNDVVALDHETGKVVIEKPGYKTHECLADSLESLLLKLNPTLDEY